MMHTNAGIDSEKSSNGILLGMISYVLMNLICGNKKKVTPTMAILAILFVLKYIFI